MNVFLWQPIKYTTGSAKSKTREEKPGMPTFSQERADERASKKVNSGIFLPID